MKHTFAVPEADAKVDSESFDESFVIDVNATRLSQEVTVCALLQSGGAGEKRLSDVCYLAA